MPAAPETTPDALRSLLEHAGIPVDEQRLPDLVTEYASQMGFVQIVEASIHGAPTSSAAPYDPTFPATGEETSR